MDIEKDSISGAAVLTERALNHLYNLSSVEYSSRKEFLSFIRKECSKISESQKSMISLRNELFFVLKAAEGAETLEEAKENLEKSILDRLQFLKDTETAIIEYGITLIRKGATILTHSRSSTVEKILFSAYKKTPFDVVVTESRPNCEGRLLAEALGRDGIPVTFIVDAAASFFTPDLVLVGADSVTPHYVINKIGTKFLAACFPTYVACATNKFTTEDLFIEEKDPEEVLEQEYENVTVRNYYFDRTPLDLVKGFITEYGIFTPEKVKSLFQY
jgi:translation initiation factor eIF-2B subunit delta